MAEAHSLFDVWSPDEAAECLPGLSDSTCSALWDLVAEYDDRPRSEVPDDFGSRCLSLWWDRLTEAQQEEVNAAAVRFNEDLGI